MTLRFETANLDFATGSRADREHLAWLCARNDVLLLQECWNIDLQELLPDGWLALQDRTDPGRANSAIAYREAVVAADAFTLRLGTKPFIGRRRARMRWRWIATAHLHELATHETFFGISAHLPPKRFRWLQPRMIKRLRKIAVNHPRTVLGVDANRAIGDIAGRLGLKPHGQGIIGILTGPYIRTAGDVEIHHYGKRNGYTDHITVKVPCRDADKIRPKEHAR